MNQRQRRRVIMKIKRKSLIGPRCKDFFPGCIICACHHFYAVFKRFPTFEEALTHNDDLVILAATGAIK